jgi:hypothetical protein
VRKPIGTPAIQRTVAATSELRVSAAFAASISIAGYRCGYDQNKRFARVSAQTKDDDVERGLNIDDRTTHV